MGKNTDKLFITHSEWATSSGGYSASGGQQDSANARLINASSLKQPFWYCCISQQPISKGCGLISPDGFVFDLKNIYPFLNKHGNKNPVTNEPLVRTDLIKLHIAENASGAYVDPVTFKEFTKYSEAVCIKTTGNVYDAITIKDMCYKTGNLKDLLTETEFRRHDVTRLMGGIGVGNGVKNTNTNVLVEKSKPKRIISPPSANDSAKKSSTLTSYHTSASLTSTSLTPSLKTNFAEIPLDQLLKPKKFTTNAYITIETNYGNLNLELWPTHSPKAVWNFITLAQRGYYDGVKFHRNIKHFMIQGGDPTGSGSGGASAFDKGRPFSDEYHGSPYRHDDRGIISMANKGKNTNTSQFFIGYRKCPHLDGKHTVFGKVVGGLDVLDKLERTPTRGGGSDVPKDDIIMLQVRVFVNPFEDMMKTDEKKALESDFTELKQVDDTPWLKRASSDGVKIGKYLNPNKNEVSKDEANDDDDMRSKRRRITSLSKSNFSNW
ncbi:cyclophilin-like protein [Nadsonia fulvescens var. elongata DSM 6958]|uniref:Cyclophilin-like protein n=1 Tax=Nadsonia fulvescens var. elongata DSM 6958 TaxID=857566 RepID=A0A1E3PGK0_9ASCO|nr:cyclophilin-like protein [Nadsonia fulvescens var. elongata DSM 6958]